MSHGSKGCGAPDQHQHRLYDTNHRSLSLVQGVAIKSVGREHVRVALQMKLRSLRYHNPRLCRIAVFNTDHRSLAQTIVSIGGRDSYSGEDSRERGDPGEPAPCVKARVSSRVSTQASDCSVGS